MQELFWLWLANVLGSGAQNAGDILKAYHFNAEDVYHNREEPLLRKMLTSAQYKRAMQLNLQDGEKELEKSNSNGITVVPFSSSAYPVLLKQIAAVPPVLYVKGDVALLNGHLSIGMVGARLPSAYGVEVTKELGKQVASAGIVLVSGLAAGLDAQAHKAALAAEGATIACIAFGHGVCYPANNRHLLEVIERKGAVVSEYPFGTTPEKAFFLQRNRLIAGISQGIMVVEARKRSGTMSTVNFAAEYGRDVFAVPGSIFSPLSGGTNDLLREGAAMVSCVEDVLALYEGQFFAGEVPKAGGVPLLNMAFKNLANNIMQPSLKPETFMRKKLVEDFALENELVQPEEKNTVNDMEDLSEFAQQVFAQLGVLPLNISQICEQAGLNTGAVMAALTELELKGLIRQLAGRNFTVMQ